MVTYKDLFPYVNVFQIVSIDFKFCIKDLELSSKDLELRETGANVTNRD